MSCASSCYCPVFIVVILLPISPHDTPYDTSYSTSTYATLLRFCLRQLSIAESPVQTTSLYVVHSLHTLQVKVRIPLQPVSNHLRRTLLESPASWPFASFLLHTLILSPRPAKHTQLDAPALTRTQHLDYFLHTTNRTKSKITAADHLPPDLAPTAACISIEARSKLSKQVRAGVQEVVGEEQ